MNLLRLFKRANPLAQIDSHIACVLQSRRYDHENYLAGLCIKNDKTRRVMYALRAFNVELALIKDKTTNSDRAKMRFQFWTRLVDEIIKRNSGTENNLNEDKSAAYYRHSPVAKELLELFYHINIDDGMKEHLHDLIGARVSGKILGYQPFADMAELELYCLKSNAGIYHLCWAMSDQLNNKVGAKASGVVKLKAISDHLGVAQGLSNVLRAIPYNYEKNTCHIPVALLEEHKLTTRDFVSNMKRPQIDMGRVRPVIEFLANECATNLNIVHSQHLLLPRYYYQMFLPRVAIESYLRRLRKYDHDVFHPVVRQRDGRLPLNLWLRSKHFQAPIFG